MSSTVLTFTNHDFNQNSLGLITARDVNRFSARFKRSNVYSFLLSISYTTMQSTFLNSAVFRSFLRLFDVLFSALVIGPLVIIYWTTTWRLSDIFITPDDQVKSAAISLVIGFVGQFILVFYQDSIAKLLKFENHKLINLLMLKVYAIFVAQTSIHFWRGIWQIIDFLSASDTVTMTMNVVQNLLILMLSKVLKNSLATPFVVIKDQMNADYAVTTRCRRVVNNFSMTLFKIKLTFDSVSRKPMEDLRIFATAFVR